MRLTCALYSVRLQLQAASKTTRRQKKVLVIAQLDRPARSVLFITTLLEAEGFRCCDQPVANRLTLDIFDAVAENERAMIAARTKAFIEGCEGQG